MYMRLINAICISLRQNHKTARPNGRAVRQFVYSVVLSLHSAFSGGLTLYQRSEASAAAVDIVPEVSG